ncbi:YitT family protein [Sporolactobacillus terrae]|uniref:Membrane protein n=1 Tax=Sporolactobacillus terrae TaxID=269673 RepID=A0A5K7X0J5_9BACL|nr:YitT family protein [Sporolactobacillus terrae]UAK15152.1 YitT family protein [Sporolactobacillus terrae]BBN99499.1 membrane protein [Sporolactobacillus terrae]
MEAAENNIQLKKQHNGLKFYQYVLRAFLIAVGVVFEAIALEAFLVPNKIIDGGVVGISIMMGHIFSLPIGIFLVIINLPFFIIGYKQMGKTFTITSACAVILLAFLTTVFSPIHRFTNDLLLAAVFGGIIMGIGVGLVIRNGGSSDGTEILAVLFNQKTPFSVGEVVLFLNIFILGSAGFVFGWNYAMYSLIAYFVAFKMIDITSEGLESSKAVWIISDLHEEIGDALNDRLGRGVTYLNGEGAYTGNDKNVIFTVISRLEEAKVKNIVDSIDKHAFLAISDIHDVKGGRFKKRSIH